MTWHYAALALDSGIPMSVLLDEPDGYVDAMFAVQQYRADLMDKQRKG